MFLSFFRFNYNNFAVLTVICICCQIAWAPGKGVKGREYKEFFDVNLGVTYIPWDKLVGHHVDLEELADGGWIDPETMPPGYQATTSGWLKEELNLCLSVFLINYLI